MKKQSEREPNDQDDRTWNEISKVYQIRHGRDQTAKPLQSKWCSIKHETQVYLDAWKQIPHKRLNHITESETDEMVIQLYYQRSKSYENDGVKRLAAPFTVADVFNYVHLLSKLENIRSSWEALQFRIERAKREVLPCCYIRVAKTLLLRTIFSFCRWTWCGEKARVELYQRKRY